MIGLPTIPTVLAVVVVVALLVVAALAFATAAGARLGRASTVGTWVAEALLALNAVVDLGRIVTGRRPDELVVHLLYVLVSVTLLPILVRPLDEDAADDDVRGRQLVLSAACLAVVVVVWRQAVTA